MQIKAGTKLLKFPVNPRIYVVSDNNGLINHIPDAETAVALYGSEWQKKIIELPEVYYLFYTEGEQLDPIENTPVSVQANWYKTYTYNGPTEQGNHKEWSNAIAVVTGNNFVKAGSVGSHSVRQGLLTKIGTDGTTLFDKKLGPTNVFEHFTAVKEVKDTNGYLVAGQQTVGTSKSNDMTRIAVTKVHADGSIVWEKTYDGKSNVTAIEVDATQGYTIAGTYYDQNAQVYKAYIMKLDFDGNVLWDKKFADKDDATNIPNISALQKTPDGGYIISGLREGDDFESKAWLLKLDKNGNTEWEKLFDKPHIAGLKYVTALSDGSLVTIDTRFSDFPFQEMEDMSTPYAEYPHIMKFDAQGNMLWEKYYTDNLFKNSNSIENTVHTQDEFVSSVISFRSEMITSTKDGGFMLTGTQITNVGNVDKTYTPWVRLLDKNGVVIKDKTFSNTDNELGLWGQQYDTNKYIMYGRRVDEKNKFVRSFTW